MALPNPGMDAVPFTPLTAEFLDDMIENIESLSDGTGFENGAITTNTLADNGVTPAKLYDFNSGTNSNGSWIQFPDGTMICYTVLSSTITTNESSGSVFFSPLITLNFPQTFIAAPNNISYFIDWVNGRPWSSLSTSNTTTSTSTRIAGATNSSQARVSAIAIGSWK